MAKYKELSYPETFKDSYTDKDRAHIRKIIDWFNTHKISQISISKAAKMSPTSFNTVLKGTYISPPGIFISDILETIKRHDARKEEGVQDCPFVETSIYDAVNAACKRAHLYRNFSVVSAFVGTGKTRCLKRYAMQNTGVFFVGATPNMNPNVLLMRLVDMTKAVVHKSNRHAAGTKADRMEAIINYFKDTDSLIIFDEAETVCGSTLEYLRRISDEANIGVVVAGTEFLKPMIRDPRGRFGQISSRVGFWPPVIEGITENDSTMLSRAAFGEDIDISDEALDALWQMCGGSARVLVSALVPAIKDYGLRKGHSLTPDLIFHIGNKILGFSTNSERRA